ncbi:MAG TPA: hypothetical protein VMT89_00660, partial [Candidatus Acidoferrales bacterium]|nr:hypothetical protein [Candidatus Acidoferrales bacterium]
LRLMHDLLHHPDVWNADIAEIVDWWTAREQVRVETLAGAVRIVNTGTQSIDGLQLVLEYIGVRTLIVVPELAPGGEHLVELAHGREPAVTIEQYSLFPPEFSAGSAGQAKEQSSR